MDSSTVSVIIFSLLLSIYMSWKWTQSYWRRKGIPFVDPMFLGDPSEYITKSYNSLKKQGVKLGGMHIFFHPVLLILDLKLLKDIMQTNFSHFVNRDVYYNEKVEPLMANLFTLRDDTWKNKRSLLTPVFSAAKMKMMFQIFVDTTAVLIDTLKKYSSKNESVELKDLFERFTTDIVGSCAFGIECNSLENPNSEFLKTGRAIIKSMNFRIAMMYLIPEKVLHFFKVRLSPKFTEVFFRDTVQNTIKYREENNIQRADLLQSLLQLKNDCNEEMLSLNRIAAECLVCYTAGYETSSTAMTMALLEMALNRQIQIKLRNEINSCLAHSEGDITYEVIMNMEYLDQVVNETLRKHTPARFMFRVCNNDYKIPDSELMIKKGTKIILPYHSIHQDPEYYPEPDKFDPERFNRENKKNIPTFAFLPFGDGPRVCIAYRFGLLQIKVGLIAILKSFEVSLSEKCQQPIQFGTGLLPKVKGGAWMNFKKIN